MADTLSELYGGVAPVAKPAPADPIEVLEKQEVQRQKYADVSFGEVFSRAVGLDHTAVNFMEARDTFAFEPETGFELPEDFVEQMQERQIPLDWAEEFTDAESSTEFAAMLDLYQRRAADESLISQTGGKGVGARIAASMTDPVGLAVDAGASLLAGAGAANRVRKITRAAMAGGAANAAVGAGQGFVDPNYGAETFMADLAVGAVMGSAFETGSMLLDPTDRAAFAHGIDAFTKNVRSGSFGKDTLSAARASQRVNFRDVDNLNAAERDVKGGDARELLKQRADENSDIETRFGAAQNLAGYGTISGQLRTAGDEQVRQLARDLVPDPVQAIRRDAAGNVESVTNEVAASDLATINRLGVWNPYRRATEEAMRNMFTGMTGGFKRMFSQDARQAVMRRVSRAMKGLEPITPDIAPIVQASRRVLDDSFEMMKRAGVKGMDTARKAADYIPRLPRRHLHDTLRSRMKSDDVFERVTEVLQAGLRSYRTRNAMDVNDALNRKVAEAYAKRLLTNVKAKPDTADLSTRDFEYVEQIIEDSKLSAAEKDELLLYFNEKDAVNGDNAKPTPRLKERLGMDEHVSIKLDDGTDFHLADLFEDDMEYLLDRYAWESSGLSALAEKGYTSPKEMENIINDLYAQNRMSDDEFQAAQVAYKGILGKPVENDPTGTMSRAVRTLNGFNFVTVMGQVFWSMLAENGAIMAVASTRSLMKQLPALNVIAKQVSSGELGDDLARELAALAEPGTTMLRNVVSLRPDEFGMEGLNGSKLARTVDRASAGAQRLTSVVSLLGPLQDFQQVLFSRSFAQRMFDFASGKQSITPAIRERLKDYGLRERDIEKLMDHMRTNAVAKNGMLKSVALDQMDDDLVRRVQVLFHRATRHVVQEQDIGATMPWMHKPLAKVLMQFRTFSMVAASRRTMHSLARADVTAGLMLGFGMAWGTLGILGRTHANYDKNHPARKAASDPVQLAKSAFAATGESTLLPMLIDSAMVHLGRSDPFFNNMHRSTGLGTDFVSGIPAVATLNKIGKAAGMPSAILHGNVSEADVRATIGLIPMNNVIGINRFNRWWASQFPSEYEVQKKERAGQLQ